MNANYMHFNASGREAARFFAVTNCCFMMNLFHNTDYIFNNDYVFRDRFDPDKPDYFSAEGKITGPAVHDHELRARYAELKLYDYSERGKDSTNLKFNLAGQSMGAHVSEFPVGSYKKGHRHGPGAHLIILNGQGYTILWEPGRRGRCGSTGSPAPWWCRPTSGCTSISTRARSACAIWPCTVTTGSTSRWRRAPIAASFTIRETGRQSDRVRGRGHIDPPGFSGGARKIRRRLRDVRLLLALPEEEAGGRVTTRPVPSPPRASARGRGLG